MVSCIAEIQGSLTMSRAGPMHSSCSWHRFKLTKTASLPQSPASKWQDGMWESITGLNIDSKQQGSYYKDPHRKDPKFAETDVCRHVLLEVQGLAMVMLQLADVCEAWSLADTLGGDLKSSCGFC